MDRRSPLGQLLSHWHQDIELSYIDLYEVVEDALPSEPAALQELLTALDAFLARTTSEERYAELDRLNFDDFPFRAEHVDPFLTALRRRLVAGLEDAEPAPLASPAGLLWPRDVPEGPFPELLRLARYLEEHVAGVRTNPFLSEEANGDAVVVTTARLDDLADLYRRRLLAEVERIHVETGSEQERRELLGGDAVWDPTSEVDYWLEVVELCVRHLAQHDTTPDEVSPELLAELRDNAALWPHIERRPSWAAALLSRWRDDDPYPAVDTVLAGWDAARRQAAREELDALLALTPDQRRRIVDVLLGDVPSAPPLDEVVAEVRRRVTA